MSVKEMYMGREMTGATTLAESVYDEMGGDTPLITESQTVKGAVNELKTIEGTEAYDNTATYAVGDYCIYNSTRYKCITAVTTAEDFDSTKWSATTTNNDITQLNSSFTNNTTYSTDTTERVLIGYKQGKPLYRQYLTYSNLTVPVNTEQILTSASIPSGAGNISISDKSYIETGTTRMNACCANSNVYSVGTSIRWRQTYSSGSSWNLYIWVEYTL